MSSSSISTLKFEQGAPVIIKDELEDAGPSPYMEEDDVYEDAGDLDFTQAQQQLWLTHIPPSLWETWSTLRDDDEIEIGTIRVEGQESDPTRVSLKLHPLPQFQMHPKEYNLLATTRDKARLRRPGNAFLFSEKDLPGYKSRSFAANNDDEEDGPGQGRSFLYEKNKREIKKKENKKRFEPYVRRPIPKQTALVGEVTRDFEITPVHNEEFSALEKLKTETMLKLEERPTTSFRPEDLKPLNYLTHGSVNTIDKAAVTKQLQKKKQAAKDNRSARMPRNVLIDKLLSLFKRWEYWPIRRLKNEVNQPEAYLREVLNEIAKLWKSGDFNGTWELKPEYKEQDSDLMKPEGLLAPDMGGSDESAMEDEEENEAFEDVE